MEWAHLYDCIQGTQASAHYACSKCDINASDLVDIHVALVRSVLEYRCVVWHNALPAYLSGEIERVQMRALRVIHPRSSYQEALQLAKTDRLEDRRDELCMRTFDKTTKGGPLSKHLTPIRTYAHDYSFRNSNSRTSFKCKTERFRRSFLPIAILTANANCWGFYSIEWNVHLKWVSTRILKMGVADIFSCYKHLTIIYKSVLSRLYVSMVTYYVRYVK